MEEYLDDSQILLKIKNLRKLGATKLRTQQMNLGLKKIIGQGQDSDEKVKINFDQTLFVYMHQEKIESVGSSIIIPGALSRTANSEMPINMDFRL